MRRKSNYSITPDEGSGGLGRQVVLAQVHSVGSRGNCNVEPVVDYDSHSKPASGPDRIHCGFIEIAG